jgi:hypothetical protein
MSVKEAVGDLNEIREHAKGLVDSWYPNLAKGSPRDYRIQVQSIMGHLIRLMEMRAPRY